VTRDTNRYRKLLITVEFPGAVVASRRGRYSDITPRESPISGNAGSVDSLEKYRPVATRGIALVLPGSDPKKVPVEVVIEALGPIQLTINTQGGAALDVEFHLVARAEGEIVDRYERSFTARVRPDGVAAIQRAFRVEGRLWLVPGIYQLQGTVRLGDPAQLASWSSTVAVPPPPKGNAPAFVGVVLSAEQESEAPLLSRPPTPDESDPLSLKPGARILPPTRGDFEVGGSLLALFWLRGIPDAGDQPPALDLTFEIADGEGRPVASQNKILFFGKEASGGYRAVARLGTATLTPGRYALHLAAKVAGQEGPTARESVSFALQAKDPTAATSASAGSP
jgi:hypothetical protein